MESLGYNFEESGLPFTEGIESNMDGFNNIRNVLKGWDAETFGVPEPHLPEMKEKLVPHAQFLKDSLADANYDSSRSLLSTANITMKSSAEFDERLSSLVNGTNDEELLLADLKVEKLESPRELKGGSVSVEESAKRARVANLQSQIPVCIVHGCNKDLSSSKEYHKRHKVCDVHSKTSVVIVNGVRQRFCQQCSRFHILAEFDNGKRSCRKRLAGHNERRRKPQLDTHFDSTFYGTDLCRTSLFFSTYLQCNEPMSHNTELLKFGSSSPPPLLHPNEMGKHNPSKNCPNSPLSVLENHVSAISNSSCAPSLLSAQSESSFSHPATNYPLSFNPNTSMFPGILSSSSGQSDQRILERGTPSEVVVHEQQPNVLGGNTVDLLQLSLHLQRVEHQKQSEQLIKLENGICSNHEYLMY